ncbi:hypothetical protein Ga0466249_004548 [Sporomusaceae bacterium BoRhaA]|uniref:hypothetical protein n=1 Tax=Pelorhabdus rhamnosifermentans TaxID=2772457 RepID=UPI001C061CB3|nr:hypothetical protein [Pelorhabdus rhamnosifermentans]MBU2703403.1 hypothetical protein [Pelorhabdus rhamnosifermentans]
MESNEVNSVFQYLDIDTEGEKINKIAFPLLAFEAMSCFVFAERISFLTTFSFAVVIFIVMFIWGVNISKNSKSLFLYLGIGSGLWSLSFILVALGASYIDLLHGCIAFIIIMLFSMPANIYIVKKNARKVLNVKGSCAYTKLSKSYYKACGALGYLIGIIFVKILCPGLINFGIIVCFAILAYMFQYVSIIYFYKHIIRRRYHIDELLEQKANAKIKSAVKQ